MKLKGIFVFAFRIDSNTGCPINFYLHMTITFPTSICSPINNVPKPFFFYIFSLSFLILLLISHQEYFILGYKWHWWTPKSLSFPPLAHYKSNGFYMQSQWHIVWWQGVIYKIHQFYHKNVSWKAIVIILAKKKFISSILNRNPIIETVNPTRPSLENMYTNIITIIPPGSIWYQR